VARQADDRGLAIGVDAGQLGKIAELVADRAELKRAGEIAQGLLAFGEGVEVADVDGLPLVRTIADF
jgi:hypothetical protein